MNEIIERAAQRFAADEGWNWETLHETDDTSFGWGREHIRRRVCGIFDALLGQASGTIDLANLVDAEVARVLPPQMEPVSITALSDDEVSAAIEGMRG